MSEFLIKVARDSVCMGDDVDAPHSYSFKLSGDAALTKVFEHLADIRYLASVAGRNHSWEAIIGEKSVALVESNNQMPETSAILLKAVSDYASDGIVNVRFKYNSATS